MCVCVYQPSKDHVHFEAIWLVLYGHFSLWVSSLFYSHFMDVPTCVLFLNVVLKVKV